MPKYRVLVSRFVEQVAEVEIEADTPEKAAVEVRVQCEDHPYDDKRWKPSDDVAYHRAYAVYAADDTKNRDILWEPS